MVMVGNDFSVWDIEEGTKLASHYNSQARITAAEFINPHDITFLLTGSGKTTEVTQQMRVHACTSHYFMYVVCEDDGAVHVWRNYSRGRPSLVTAWRALTDMLPASRSE